MNATGHLPIELLSAHLDGETTPTERARVEAHLAACEACRDALEEFRRLVDASAQLGAPALPSDLRERIAASFVRPATRRRAWIGAAASIAAVGLVATAWYLQGPEAPAPKPPLAPDAVGKMAGQVSAPPAAPPVSKAKKQEAKSRDEAANRVPMSLPRDPKREADSERARGVAPSASLGIDDGPADALAFVEVRTDGTVDRVALIESLEAIGVSPAPATDERVIELVLPRTGWSECRDVLTRYKIRVDETEVRALPGDVIGIRIRTPAP